MVAIDADLVGVLCIKLVLTFADFEEAAHDDEKDGHKENGEEGSHHAAANHAGADGALAG